MPAVETPRLPSRPPEEIQRVARSKIYFRRLEPPDASDYLLDHSGFIYLRGADGRHLGFFPPGTPAERIDAAVRMHLGEATAPRWPADGPFHTAARTGRCGT